MDGLLFSESLSTLSHVLTLKTYDIAAFTLLVYDYCLTFSAEFEFAWKPRQTIASALFLLNRYISLTFSTMVVISHFSPNVTSTVCNNSVLVGFLFTILIFAIAEIFAAFRIYIFTHKNIYIIVILLFAILSRLILGFVMISQHRVFIAGPLQTIEGLANPHTFQVCAIAPDVHTALLSYRLLMAYLSTILIFNIIVFIITLTMALTFSRTGPSQHWFQVMQRDGVMYFMIFSSTLVWLIGIIHLPDYLGLMNIVPAHIFTALIMNRIYLSLKEDGQNISLEQTYQITTIKFEQTENTIE